MLPAFIGFRYPDDSHALDRAWELGCLAIVLAGLSIRVAVVGTTPAGTSGRNTHGQVAETLNTSGMYSVARHPLYLGNYLMWLGISLFPRVWWAPLLITALFWIYYERIMMAEEAYLERKFGAVWVMWARVTPAILPNLPRWRPPDLPFSWPTVLRREYSGLFGAVAILTAFDLLSEWIASGRVSLDPMWGVLFGVTAVLYLLLRTLKRATRWLRVPGR